MTEKRSHALKQISYNPNKNQERESAQRREREIDELQQSCSEELGRLNETLRQAEQARRDGEMQLHPLEQVGLLFLYACVFIVFDSLFPWVLLFYSRDIISARGRIRRRAHAAEGKRAPTQGVY